MYKNVSSFNLIIAFALCLFFFPSITFGILEAEVFPWGVLLSSLFILYRGKISTPFVLILGFFLCNVLVFSFLNISDLKISEVVRSLLAYINSIISLVVFYQLSEINILRTTKLVKSIFLFLIVLGILQVLNVLGFIDFLFKFLIPRSSATSLSHMNRGATLLSTEPARAGISFVFIYLVVRTVFILQKRRLWYDIGVFLFLALIVQSFMSLSLYIVYLVLVYRMKLVKYILVLSLLVFVGGFFALGGRSVDLLNSIVNQNNFSDILFLLVDNSGHRLLSIYSSWLYAVTNPFGGGIGYWESSSLSALDLTGLDLSQFRYFIVHGDSKAVPIRSSGYISNLVLDVGLVGFVIFAGFMYTLLKKFWSISRESKNIIMIFIFKIMFIGSVGTPVAWIASIIALKYLYNKSVFLEANNVKQLP